MKRSIVDTWPLIHIQKQRVQSLELNTLYYIHDKPLVLRNRRRFPVSFDLKNLTPVAQSQSQR